MSQLELFKLPVPSAPGPGIVRVGADQNGVLTSVDGDISGLTTVLSGRALYNWVTNSGFWFAQRQTPGSATTYSATSGRAFAADRWAITNENASAQYSRTDTTSAPETGLQATFYGNFTKITSTGKLVMSQALISDDCLNLRGRTVRLQLKLKSIVASSATWRIGLVQLTSSGTVDSLPATFISAFGANSTDPTLGTNLSYIAPKSGQTEDNCVISGSAASCALTTSWQRFSVLFDVPTDCKNLVVMVWSDSQVAATNGVAMSEVSLTDGHEIQTWTPEEYQMELLRVQRFLCKTFGVNTAPAQNLGNNTGNLDCIAGKTGATALAAQFQWRYWTRMWTVPTVTTYNPAAANAQVRNVAQGNDGTATATTATAEMVRITATGVGGGGAWAVGDQCSIHVLADADF